MNSIIRLLSRSSITYICSTAEDIISVLKKESVEFNLYLIRLINKIETTNNKIISVINRRKQSDKKYKADILRDKKTRALMHITNALIYSPIEVEAESATIVKRVTDIYGFKIMKKGYNSQTPTTDALLSDLDAPNIKAAIDKVKNLRIMVEELREANENFKQAYTKNIIRKMELNKTPSATEFRPVILSMLNDELIPALAIMSRIDPDTYLSCYNTIHEIVSEHNRSVKTHLNRLKAIKRRDSSGI